MAITPTPTRLHDHAIAPTAPAHDHGTMDIREQERTFDGFLRLVSWALTIVIVILIFLALVNL